MELEINDTSQLDELLDEKTYLEYVETLDDEH